MWGALIGAGVAGITSFFDQRNRNRQVNRYNQYGQGTRDIGAQGADQVLNHQGNFFLGPDPRSIQDQAAQFHNPYQSQVIDGIRSQYDHLRGQARLNQNAGATLAGAFGSDRSHLEMGARMGELDRAQMQQVGNLLHSDWYNSVDRGLQYSEYQRNLRERQAQEPLWRHQQAINLRNSAQGPMPAPTGSPWMAGAGAAMNVGGAYYGSPLSDWMNNKFGGGGMVGGPAPRSLMNMGGWPQPNPQPNWSITPGPRPPYAPGGVDGKRMYGWG